MWDKIKYALLAILAALAGVLATMAVYEAQDPYCPTEDSCLIEYDGREWHIIETVP